MASLRAIFGHKPASRRELMAMQDHVDGLEHRVEQHYGEFKSLRGLVNSLLRREKSREDAPGETIEDGEVSQEGGPVKRFQPTAHLARRFRSL